MTLISCEFVRNRGIQVEWICNTIVYINKHAVWSILQVNNAYFYYT